MALKRYEVALKVGRHTTKTVLKLTEAEAERLGGVEVKPAAKQAAVQNKKRTPANKGTGK